MPRKNSSSVRSRRPPASRIKVSASGIHGLGVYATALIRKGTRIIEYTGKHLPWKLAMEPPAHRPDEPHHTFFFSLENGDVIDANQNGNEARWINHSCDPNCETSEEEDRIFVEAIRTLRPGDELFYDYRIVPAERRTKKLEKDFACHCGSPKCRGTMLEPKAPKRRIRSRKNSSGKKRTKPNPKSQRARG